MKVTLTLEFEDGMTFSLREPAHAPVITDLRLEYPSLEKSRIEELLHITMSLYLSNETVNDAAFLAVMVGATEGITQHNYWDYEAQILEAYETLGGE